MNRKQEASGFGLEGEVERFCNKTGRKSCTGRAAQLLGIKGWISRNKSISEKAELS